MTLGTFLGYSQILGKLYPQHYHQGHYYKEISVYFQNTEYLSHLCRLPIVSHEDENVIPLPNTLIGNSPFRPPISTFTKPS